MKNINEEYNLLKTINNSKNYSKRTIKFGFQFRKIKLLFIKFKKRFNQNKKF